MLDRNFIISLVLKSDDNYKRAKKLADECLFENKCYVSDLIIQELFTALRLNTKNMSFFREVIV